MTGDNSFEVDETEMIALTVWWLHAGKLFISVLSKDIRNELWHAEGKSEAETTGRNEAIQRKMNKNPC